MSTSFSRGWSPHSQSQVQSFQYPAIPRHAFCRETPDSAVSDEFDNHRNPSIFLSTLHHLLCRNSKHILGFSGSRNRLVFTRLDAHHSSLP